jgi:hypothetical protein
MAANNSSGAAAMPSNVSLDDTDLSEPNYDHLDLSYANSSSSSTEPSCSMAKAKSYDDLSKKGSEPVISEYILGTLIVRVVAARDLEPVQKNGLGQMVFGGGSRSSRTNRVSGTANPYCSVKFGSSTQRTSEVFDSLDPMWPRQEAMFMDVSLSTSELTHPAIPEPSQTNNTSQSAASAPPAGRSALPSPTAAAAAYKAPSAVLTVALFHAVEIGKVHKYPSKGKGGGGSLSGDSDDLFMGMASIDLTQLITGRRRTFDEWLPLSGTEQARGTVRIVCEYEASDGHPRPGDTCRFTSFCNPADLFPVTPGRAYRVDEVDGDTVLISYESQEGWICSFEAHRFMLVCEERHHGAIEMAQDELASISERLAHSPIVHTVTETAERIAVDGLISIGNDVVRGGFSLVGRWFEGGLGTAISDVTNATNWDGRFNPGANDSLDLPSPTANIENNVPAKMGFGTDEQGETDARSSRLAESEPLPNMPECPITGEPMLDPVVAADGTYFLLMHLGVFYICICCI